ncbi:peptidoglycan DD-metalloendopeptidase family protein [Nemorincola caseinilytica]|uniref:Peptidoglycan DD-metalloendopeptidase family protein n=2 Tax=Nemorincola caseinilytica TaxID=2054315 RepID=A0ABP8N8K3_9BACT
MAAMAQSGQVQYSMSKDTLIQRRKAIMEAINETERQLAAIKSDKQATMGQLRALQNKLADRQRLIGNINQELNNIDHDIRASSREVQTLKQKLDQLQIRYAQSLRYSYTTRSSYDMLAFLFSSRDFNDAVRRMKYLKKFRDFRKYQVTQIAQTQTQLKTKIGTLNAVKTEKDQLLNTQVQQKQVLQRETDQTNQVVQDLKTKESKLLADIEKNRKVTARINKAINDLIEREMAKATAEARKTGKGTSIKSSSGDDGTTRPPTVNDPTTTRTRPREKPDVELLLTPEDVELAENFEGNRGRMYWPVEKGYITDHYGKHPHPLAPKVIINNDGIDIQTDENARVRCVFKGVVSTVFSVPGGNAKIVMVKHGNYCTVYNGLASVSVRAGDEVNAKQTIGTVAINDEGQPVINFQIWKAQGKGNATLNPELWIGKAR